MVCAWGLVALVGVMVVHGSAQVPSPRADTPLTFDAVSVKRNTTSTLPAQVSLSGRTAARGYSTCSSPRLISFAYPPAVPTTMEGLPSWAMSERYDVVATSRLQTASPDQRAAMFRAMLAERFKLSAHFEPRETATYDLVFARDDRKLGPNLVPSTEDCNNSEPGQRTSRSSGSQCPAAALAIGCGTGKMVVSENNAIWWRAKALMRI